MDINPEIIQVIHESFTRFFQAQKAPGLVYGITLRGQVLYFASFGAQRLAPEEPMTPNSFSRIASITKSFATVAVLQLRDAGLLDIDSPLSSIVKVIRLSDTFSKASLRELMAMKLDLATDDPWADRLLGATNEEIDPYLRASLVRAGLGPNRCAYSNLSYFLLGRIIAIVSGRPLMDYITEEITVPLGMHDTVWDPPDRLQGRIALGYRADRDTLSEEEYYRCGSDAVAFGGLWSTASDLACWLEFLRAAEDSPAAWESVLRRSSRSELSQPYASYDTRPFESTITGQTLENTAGYGFGVVRSTIAGLETLSHSGGLPGYGSHMRVDIRSGYGIVALANGTYCPVWTPCMDALLYLVHSVAEEHLVDTDTVVILGKRLAHYLLAGATDERNDLFTYNFWRDNRIELFSADLRSAMATLGSEVEISAINARSGYQGEISFRGKLGKKKLSFQLAPHLPARIQHVSWG